MHNNYLSYYRTSSIQDYGGVSVCAAAPRAIGVSDPIRTRGRALRGLRAAGKCVQQPFRLQQGREVHCLLLPYERSILTIHVNYSINVFDVACFLAHVVGSSAGQVQWSRWPSHRGRVILFSTEVSLLVVQTEPPVYIQNYKYTMMCGRIKVGRHNIIHNYIVPESVSFIINYRAEGLER